MKNKQEILQASCQYFYQYGFHGSSIEAIAQNAGITKKTLYRYFVSKEQLIEACLAYRHEWFMQNLLTSLDGLTGESAVQGYLDFLKTWLMRDDFFGCMFINACAEFSERDNAFHQQSLQHKRQVINLLKHKISDTNKHSENLINTLFINGEGLIVARQVGIIDDKNIDEVIQSTYKQLSSFF